VSWRKTYHPDDSSSGKSSLDDDDDDDDDSSSDFSFTSHFAKKSTCF
jgi:hypothetical protein